MTMNIRKSFRSILGMKAAVVPTALLSAAVLFISSSRLAAASTLYSPEPAPRLRLLFDYYHHLKPSTKVGEHLVTGGWANNVGRYGWDDFAHTNSFDPVFAALEEEHAIYIHEEPFSSAALSKADGVVIVNPDSPVLTPTVPVLTDEEIGNLTRFVREGGSLMVLINSGGHATEKFEDVQLRKLVNGFGLDWNSDDTHYTDITLGNTHPYFYDVPVFHYGAGCTVEIDASAEAPEVLMHVYSDPRYTERDVDGPGIVMVRPGKGKVILVGDTGSWGANVSRPWADNVRVMKQLFRYLQPSQGVTLPTYEAGSEFTYDFEIAGLTAMDFNNNTLTSLERPHHRMFRPRPKTALPYVEASGTLNLSVTEVTDDAVATLAGELKAFRWFDEADALGADESLELQVSRQGKVSAVTASGEHAQFVASDLGALSALIPSDGLRVGDRWETLEQLAIPTLRGTDRAITKTVEWETCYVRDEVVEGVDCRLLRSAQEIWLNEIDVDIEDMLPEDEIRQWAGAHYQLMKERGGTLLVRREQWVEKATGQVIRAKTQSRIVAWIWDTDKPLEATPADRDKHMVTSVAHIVTFNRQ